MPTDETLDVVAELVIYLTWNPAVFVNAPDPELSGRAEFVTQAPDGLLWFRADTGRAFALNVLWATYPHGKPTVEVEEGAGFLVNVAGKEWFFEFLTTRFRPANLRDRRARK